jgi:hypothetical protein
MSELDVPGEIVFDHYKWKVYRQDAGMGEKDYAIFKYDIFFARTEHEKDAMDIISALNYCQDLGK